MINIGAFPFSNGSLAQLRLPAAIAAEPTAVALKTTQTTVPPQLFSPRDSPVQLQAQGLVSGFAGGVSGGAAGSAGGPIGTIIGAVAGFLGGLFGGGSSDAPPTIKDQFISDLRALFPDQNAPICGVPINMDGLNGGLPATLNVDCNDSQFGNISRSTLEWFISTYGLGSLIKLLQKFIETPQASGGSSGAGGLNTTINIGADALSGIAGAITGALGQVIKDQTSQLNGITGAITGALDSGIGALFNGLINGQNNLASTIEGIISSVFNPLNALVGALTADVLQSESVLHGIVNDILNPLGADIQTFAQSLFGLSSTLIQEIEKVLGPIVRGLEDVFRSLPGVLEKIVHAIEVLTGTLPGKANSKIGSSDVADAIAAIVQAGAAISGAIQHPLNVEVNPQLNIGPSCTLQDAVDKLNAAGRKNIHIPDWLRDAMDYIIAWVIKGFQAVPVLEQFTDLATEQQNIACPITKLGPGDVINAWRRRILTEESAKNELNILGFSPARSSVLFDLAAYRIPSDQAIDWWWKGIVDDNELADLLKINGLDDEQVTAFKDASFRLTDLEAGLLGWKRGVLNDDQLNAISSHQHLNTAQQALYKLLSLRPGTPEEILRGENIRHALGIISIPGFTAFDNIPSWFSSATRSAGLDADATEHLWWAHYDLGNPGLWTTLYFRGLRSFGELGSALDAFNIPTTLQTDFIESQRPLIPFRTIPAMIAGGILTDDEGKSLLRQHGFDEASIGHLLNYAKGKAKTTKSATATANHALSQAQAKTLFLDGAITDQQYIDVLKAHGFSDQDAQLELQVTQLTQATSDRKQAATDIVNEFQAGLIDKTTALQQLAQQNFTIAEQAKYAKQLKTSAASKAKIPGEAELNHFLQKSIITPQQYLQALTDQGYSDKYAQWYLALRTGP